MESKILLNYTDNVKLVEESLRLAFLIELLEKLNITAIQELELSGDSISVAQRMQLRDILAKNSITILEEDGMEVFFEKELIARWDAPTYVVKRDFSEPDPKKQLYQEMTIHFFSLFEEQEE